ncbi:MORN repeat-containing protein 4 [Oncorhynchus kisutch]|nr:MORN repeat-containing protein 4-like [Oncorhynchus kisutch]XP_031672902.1 MORN repeat-containing protein 4-like [Oncorhynchus kisutch]
MLVFPDGSRYEGDFIQGKFQGAGVFSRFDGMKFEGEFKSGCVQGYGMLTFADGGPERGGGGGGGRGGGRGGTSHEGLFERGQLVGREGCQGTVQRAQGAAAKARALSM